MGVISAVMQDWQQFATNLRICSFSANNDSFMAWDRYGDHHRGVAIRLKRTDFSPLSSPYQVQYRTQRPEIMSLEGQVHAMLNRTPNRPQDHFLDLFTIRSKMWSGEQEWRCFHPLTDEEQQQAEVTEQRPFARETVAAIYLGANIDPRIREQILELAATYFPKARLFQAKLRHDRFELDFEGVSAPNGSA